MRKRTQREDRQEQAEGRDELGEPLRWTRPHLGGELQQRQVEHGVRGERAEAAADDLRDDVGAEPRASGVAPLSAMTSDTAGLKCAPEIGPSARIRTTRMAPVGMVLPRSAIATFPPASCSAMMPEPTTVATRKPGAERLGGEAPRERERRMRSVAAAASGTAASSARRAPRSGRCRASAARATSGRATRAAG